MKATIQVWGDNLGDNPVRYKWGKIPLTGWRYWLAKITFRRTHEEGMVRVDPGDLEYENARYEATAQWSLDARAFLLQWKSVLGWSALESLC